MTEQAPALGLRALVETADWSATPLGPSSGWTEALRTIVATCLGSRFPVMVFWGQDLVQIYNDAYAPLIGEKHPRALGQRAEECFPEIWDVIGPMLKGVLATGEATWSDDQMLLLDRRGSLEECYFTYSFGPAGDPIQGVFCAVLETTTRVVVERRLAVIQALSTSLAGLSRVSAVLDTAAQILAEHRHDLSGGLLRIFSEDGGQRDLSWPSAEAMGPPTDLDRIVATALETGGLVVERSPGSTVANDRTRFAAPVLRPGMARPAAVLVTRPNPNIPLDEDFREFVNQVAGAITAALSIAEGYEAAASRARALEELDGAKTAFLSNVSHEFRTPLTLLLGPLQDYQADYRIPEDVRGGLRLATRNGRRVLKLVNSLLDISRLEAGRVSATFQPTDLGMATVDLTAAFRSAAEAAGVDLIIECAPLDEPVYVDRELWEQIVTNLCANALKFTPSGSVTVRLSPGDGVALLQVIDTGIGIGPEDLKYIFDRFRRGEGSDVASRVGSGLGLALVREFVHLHHGSITVDSSVGRGTTFSVSVPLGTAHLDSARVLPDDALAPRALSTSPSEILDALPTSGGTHVRPHSMVARWGQAAEGPADPSRSTVWVVDDNADMRDYLTSLLAGRWNVVAYADADSALDAIAAEAPDLIVSDVAMPGSSGLDLVRAVRANPSCADLPIVLLSARAGEEATLEGLQAGADDYLIKPFTARELVSRIASLIRLAALRGEAAERTKHHALQLEALAAAATEIIGAESLGAIIAATEGSALLMTGAASSAVTLERIVPASEPGVRPGPAAKLGEVEIPLERKGGAPIGKIHLSFADGRGVQRRDLNLVKQLSLVASRRIEHLARYRQERSVSHTLQRSLLPDALPGVEGVELAARYRPAVATEDVGGDWYDSMLLPDGRLMISVGDVAGHDLQSAIAMSQIRLLLRARASDAIGPGELCSVVNRLLPAIGVGKMATMTMGFIDTGSGAATFVNAGHPLPVLWSSGASLSLDIPVSPPLGVQDESIYREYSTVLQSGTTLLLYTDGLVERRDEHIDESVRKLMSSMALIEPDSLPRALDLLLAAATGDSAPSDDIVLLAVRRT